MHRQELFSDPVADRSVHWAIEVHRRFEAERVGGFHADGDRGLACGSTRKSRAMKFVDRSANLSDREVDLVDRRLQAGDHHRICREPNGTLEAEPDGEEALDRGVVKVTSDAIAILQLGEFRDLCMESGIFDRDARTDCKGNDNLFVEVGEGHGTDLASEAQAVQYLTADQDRHGQQRGHR